MSKHWMDVANIESVKKARETPEAKTECLDVLINNAGTRFGKGD
jgi:NADP-dependent 3-hydroxy acid dehydrogenase YdfG